MQPQPSQQLEQAQRAEQAQLIQQPEQVLHHQPQQQAQRAPRAVLPHAPLHVRQDLQPADTWSSHWDALAEQAEIWAEIQQQRRPRAPDTELESSARPPQSSAVAVLQESSLSGSKQAQEAQLSQLLEEVSDFQLEEDWNSPPPRRGCSFFPPAPDAELLPSNHDHLASPTQQDSVWAEVQQRRRPPAAAREPESNARRSESEDVYSPAQQARIWAEAQERRRRQNANLSSPAQQARLWAEIQQRRRFTAAARELESSAGQSQSDNVSSPAQQPSTSHWANVPRRHRPPAAGTGSGSRARQSHNARITSAAPQATARAALIESNSSEGQSQNNAHRVDQDFSSSGPEEDIADPCVVCLTAEKNWACIFMWSCCHVWTLH